MLARALLLTALVLTAQPIIRVTTRLTEVNVIVRDKSGPVKGLTRDDFTLFDGGKPQKIAFFSVSSIQKGLSAAPPAGNTFTNRPAQREEVPTSATIVLLDGLNTAPQSQIYAKQQLIGFLRQIQPQDRIAVYTLGRQLSVVSDFTSDAHRLLASLNRLAADVRNSPNTPLIEAFDTGDAKTDAIWNGFLSMEQERDIERRVTITVECMEAIANHVRHIPGRKNLVWLSASFPYMIGSGLNARTFSPEVRRMAQALNGANISVYPVDARGLVALPELSAERRSVATQNLGFSVPPGQDSMQVLALRTGGTAFINRNDIGNGIRTVLDDSELTYTLGFYPEESRYDSEVRPLKVKVNRRGVDVRYRESYLAGGPDKPPAEPDVARQIRDAIRSPLEATGIGLEGSVHPDKKSITLKLVVSMEDLTLEPKDGGWTCEVEAVFSQRSKEGLDLGTQAFWLPRGLNRAQHDEAVEKGMRIQKTLELASEAVEIRVVVLDRASGKTGSLILPAQAPVR